jgi:putative transposase
MCFRLIDAKKSQHPVSLLCSVLGVSRAGYYAWKDRPASARRRRDDRLTEQISQVDAESNGTYGWPRIHAELRHRGVHVSRKRVARLMREAGLSGLVKRRKGKTTIRVPGIATAPDFVRRDFRHGRDAGSRAFEGQGGGPSGRRYGELAARAESALLR